MPEPHVDPWRAEVEAKLELQYYLLQQCIAQQREQIFVAEYLVETLTNVRLTAFAKALGTILKLSPEQNEVLRAFAEQHVLVPVDKPSYVAFREREQLAFEKAYGEVYEQGMQDVIKAAKENGVVF